VKFQPIRIINTFSSNTAYC